MCLLDMVLYWASSDPHRHAVIQPELVTTYKALADGINSTAERIEQLQLDRQSIVRHCRGACRASLRLRRGFGQECPTAVAAIGGHPEPDL
jgi:hypothetical protein